MQDTGSLGLVHWDDPEVWYGDAGTTKIYVAAPEGVRSREGSDVPGVVDQGMKFHCLRQLER